MPTGSSSPGPFREDELPPTEAELLFHEQLLGDSGDVDGDELEALCAEHPGLASELRSLAGHHRRGRALFRSDPPEDPPETARDARVGERYTVRREIARGGMGRILEVWDRELRRVLAMKIPHVGGDTAPPNSFRRRLTYSRLINEAQILAQLDHPGVVPVHEVGRDTGGRPYFTMQLVQGNTLRELLDEDREASAAFTTTRALTVLQRVCEAVAYAHSRGVLHRDLKPSNVMVGAFGEVYVMDWGLARARGRAVESDIRTSMDPLPDPPAGGEDDARGSGSALAASVRTDRREQSDFDPLSPLRTLEGDVLGTPSYMSPEQAEGRAEDVDERSDVYGAGAMLYHILCGRAPYARPGSDSTPREVLERVLSEPPTDVERVMPHASRELAAVCAKAMARDPARRYASMADLADDLSAYLEGRVVRAHRTGLAHELRKWILRHRAWTVAAGAIVLALVLSVVQELRASREQRRLNDGLTKSLYANQMQLAAGALARGDTAVLQSRLASTPAALRDWEFDVLARQADTSERTVTASGRCWVLAWSWDGSRLANVGETDVLVWRAATLERERTFPDPFGGATPMAVNVLSLSRDGALLAAVAGDGRARLWDLDANEDADPDAHEGIALPGRSFLGASFSPSSAQLATAGSDGRVALWDSRTGTQTHASDAHGAAVRAVVWSGDGSVLVSLGDDGTARGWDARELAELWRIDAPVPAPIVHLAVSPTGDRIAIGSGNAGWVRMLEVPSGELAWTFELDKERVNNLAWSPDDRTVAVASGARSPLLLDAASGAFRSRLVGHGQQVDCVQFSPDARRIVTGSHDGLLKEWDHERTLKEGWLRPDRGSIRGIAFRSDGGEVALTCLDGTLELWDVRTRTERARVRGDSALDSVAWSPDDRIVATGGRRGELVLRDADSLDVVARVEGRSGRGPIAFLPDGERIATGTYAGRLELWSWRDGELLWEQHLHTGYCSGIALSPDGSLLASAGQDGAVHLTETAAGTTRRTLQGPLVFARKLAFSRDGTRLATRGRSTDKSEAGTQVWDVASGELLWTRPGWEYGSPTFSPDGTRLLGTEWPAALAVLDATTGEEIALLPVAWGESGDRILDDPAFAVSPDGRTVVAGFREADGQSQHPIVFVEARPWAWLDR